MDNKTYLNTRFNFRVGRVFLLAIWLLFFGWYFSNTAKAVSCLQGSSCVVSATVTDPEGDPISNVTFSAVGTPVSCMIGGVPGIISGSSCYRSGTMASSVSANATYVFSSIGSYSISVSATDNAGHPSNTSIPVTVTAPVPGALTFISKPSSWTNNTTASFTWNAVQYATSYTTYIDGVLNPSPNQIATSWSQTVSAGSHTFTAYPLNASGVGTADSWTWIVDNIAPTPNPTTGYTSNVSDTSITWNINPPTDNSGGIGLHSQPYSFNNGSTWQTGSSLVESSLSCGTNYNKTIRTRDALGNTTTAGTLSATTSTCVVRSASLSGSPSSSGWRSSPTIFTYTPSCTPASGTTLSSCITQLSTNGGGSWSQIASNQTYNLVTNNCHRFRVVETDSGGTITSNIIPSSGDICLDTTNPTTPAAVGTSSNYTSNLTPTWSWIGSSDINGSGVSYYILNLYKGGILQINTTSSTTNWVQPNYSSGSFTLYVYGVDMVGNTSSSASGTVIIDITPPNQVTGLLVSPSATTSSFTISWNAASDAESGIKDYELWRAPDISGSPGVWVKIGPNTTSTSAPDTPTDGKWCYGIHANNNAGDYSTEDIYKCGIKDTVAPTPNPTTGSTSGISQTSITWNINAPTDSASGVGLSATPYSFDGGSTWQASNFLTESSLTCGTAYGKSIRTRDALGNTTTAGTLSASTSVCSVRSASFLSSSPSNSGWVQTSTFTYSPSCVAQGGFTLISCLTQKSTSQGSSWSEISSSPASGQAYELLTGNTYRFRVVATDTGGTVTSTVIPATGDMQFDNGDIIGSSKGPTGIISSLRPTIAVNLSSVTQINSCFVYLNNGLLEITNSQNTPITLATSSISLPLVAQKNLNVINPPIRHLLNRSGKDYLDNGSYSVKVVCNNDLGIKQIEPWTFTVDNKAPAKPVTQ